MSTTDTRAAFEAWAEREGCDTANTHDGVRVIWLSPMTADLWAAWQAATKAAKATGTAGGLPAMPEPFGVIGEYADEERDVWDYEQMRAYGQQCAEAARMKESSESEELEAALRARIDEFEAARQPAPVAKTLTLEQEREAFKEYYQTRAAPLKYPDEYFALVEIVMSGWETAFVYEHDWMQKHWEMWEARAKLANRSQP